MSNQLVDKIANLIRFQRGSKGLFDHLYFPEDITIGINDGTGESKPAETQ